MCPGGKNNVSSYTYTHSNSEFQHHAQRLQEKTSKSSHGEKLVMSEQLNDKWGEQKHTMKDIVLNMAAMCKGKQVGARTRLCLKISSPSDGKRICECILTEYPTHYAVMKGAD